MWNKILLGATAVVAHASAQLRDTVSPPSYPSPWMHGGYGWDDAYTKAKAFVSQLTLLEKVNLTTGVGWEDEACVGNTGAIPRLNFPGLCLQDSPLGVRFADQVSAFPAGMNVAATWSRDLMRARGVAMGAEHSGKGIDIQLGPVAGPLGRVPEGGRNWEGFSVDPVLTGVAMAETIQGIQSSNVIACGKHYILNEQEHYRQAVRNKTQLAISSNADDRTMHELYLWPFADAVKAGVGAVMTSYNRINNSYASQNSKLINDLLKNELDFQGFVMSDWGGQVAGVASAIAGLDMTMAGDQTLGSGNTFWGSVLTAAVLNGTIPHWRLDDMTVRIMSAYYKVGRDNAKVPVNFNSWTTNTTGYLHPLAKGAQAQVNFHVDVQANHAALIREIGAKSTVLLKNIKGALPLSKPKSIAVIGEDAFDNVDGPNSCPDRACNTGTLAMGWGSGTANFPYLVAPVTALSAQATSDDTIFRSVGDNYDYEAIAAAVTGAEATIVFANANSGEDYLTVGGNEGDRNNLTLWNGGDDLVDHVASLNPNTIVVLHTVGPILLESMKKHPNITAILWAGLPGQESGNSITDILYGFVNPQAKTVFTWAKERSDWGTDVLYSTASQAPQQDFAEGVFIDYRHFDAEDIEPSYEFGFGLSYTEFSYSYLQISKATETSYTPTTGFTSSAPTFGVIDYNTSAAQFPTGFVPVPYYIYPWLNGSIPTNQTVDLPEGAHDGSSQPLLPAGGAQGGNVGLYDVLYTVCATITNTGDRAGVEIAQLYIALGAPTDPPKVLRGFDDLEIEAGGAATFTYGITRRDLSNWDVVSRNWVISQYPKTVYVGSSSRDLPLSGCLDSLG